MTTSPQKSYGSKMEFLLSDKLASSNRPRSRRHAKSLCQVVSRFLFLFLGYRCCNGDCFPIYRFLTSVEFLSGGKFPGDGGRIEGVPQTLWLGHGMFSLSGSEPCFHFSELTNHVLAEEAATLGRWRLAP